MAKILRVLVNPKHDLVVLDIGNATIIPYTYHTWGSDNGDDTYSATDADIKRSFHREVTGGDLYGVQVGAYIYKEELEDEGTHTIYTAADGWLV